MKKYYLKIVLSLLYIIPIFIAAENSYAQNINKTTKQIQQETKKSILEPTEKILADAEKTFLDLQKDKNRITSFDNVIRNLVNEQKNLHRDITDSLNDKIIEYFRLLTVAEALNIIIPYHQSQLPISDIIWSQDNTIGGTIIDRRRAIADGLKTLEFDFDNLKNLANFYVNKINTISDELRAINQGNSANILKLGHDYYISKTLLDIEDYKNSAESLSAYTDNAGLNGEFQEAFVIGTNQTMPTLKEAIESIISIANSSTTYNNYNTNTNDSVLVHYFGGYVNGIQITGYKQIWSGHINTLQNSINFLNNEINTAYNNNNPALAKQLTTERDQLTRERDLAKVQESYAINHISDQIRRTRDLAQRLSNQQNGANAWRSAPLIGQENLEFMMAKHRILFGAIVTMLEVAETEALKFDQRFASETELKAAAGELSAKFRAITNSGGLRRIIEQLESARSAMQLLSQGAGSGSVALDVAINTWTYTVESKVNQYLTDKNSVIPSEITTVTKSINDERKVFDLSLARLTRLEDKLKSFAKDRDKFNSLFSELDKFYKAKPYSAIFESLIREMLIPLRDFRGLKKGESKLTKRLIKGSKKFLKSKGRIVNKRARLTKTTKLFIEKIINPFKENLKANLDKAVKSAFGGKSLFDLLEETKNLADTITDTE